MAALAAMAWLTSCQPHPAPTPHAATTPQPEPSPRSGAAPRLADAASEFNALLGKGDYAGAIAFVEKSALTAAEKDGVTGTLILDGLVDPSASTRPAHPLAEGFTRMERAAAAGREQSVADLRAKFTTGINYEGKNILLPPHRALAECWANVEAGNEKATACISMRQRLRVP